MNRTRRDFERLAPLLDVEALLDLTILVVGVGRLGMEVLRQLLPLPFKRLIVVDFDSVSDRDRGDNFPAQTTERLKVRAAAELVSAFDSRVEIEPVIMRIDRDSLQRLRDLVARSALVFWAADDWQALSLTNPLIYSRAVCVAAALSQQDGYVELAYSVPLQTACLDCALDASRKETAHGAASLPLDVVIAANLAIRLGIGVFLSGRQGGRLFADYLDPSHSLLISQTRNGAFTSSSNPLVPAMTQLVRTSGLSCDVCRDRVRPSLAFERNQA